MVFKVKTDLVYKRGSVGAASAPVSTAIWGK